MAATPTCTAPISASERMRIWMSEAGVMPRWPRITAYGTGSAAVDGLSCPRRAPGCAPAAGLPDALAAGLAALRATRATRSGGDPAAERAQGDSWHLRPGG